MNNLSKETLLKRSGLRIDWSKVVSCSDRVLILNEKINDTENVRFIREYTNGIIDFKSTAYVYEIHNPLYKEATARDIILWLDKTQNEERRIHFKNTFLSATKHDKVVGIDDTLDEVRLLLSNGDTVCIYKKED